MTKKPRSRRTASRERTVSIHAGARVRAKDGFIGTIKRLLTPIQLHSGAQDETQQDLLLVRSDDGRWRFQLPSQVITRVTSGADGQIVHISLAPQELASFATEYPREGVARDRGQQASIQQPASHVEELDDTVIRIPLAQEHLFVDKRPVVRGTVRVHTSVETEQQQLSVPVLHEEAIVERIPADELTSAAGANPDDILIPLYEERLVVEKRLIVKEYVRIRKRQVSTAHEITGVVRREVASISEEPSMNSAASDAPLISRPRRRVGGTQSV